MRGLRTAAGTLAALCLLAGAPVSQADGDWGDDFDFLIEREDTIVTVRQGYGGNPERVILVPGEVQIVQERTARGLNFYSEDRSGRGAVMCDWFFSVHIVHAFGQCGVNSAEHTAALRWSVARMKEFIVENSHGLYSTKALEERVDQIRNEEPGCFDQYREFVRITLDRSSQDIRDHTERLLSVPRFPATTPCL